MEATYNDTVVLGCGNILFGDDGFGSRVAEHLQNSESLPENACVIDATTRVREILFDLILSEHKPRRIIVVDAVDVSKKPGEVFRIGLDELPRNKIDDFTLHEMPTCNLLGELRDLCGVEVVIVAGQVDRIPETVSPGLSDALAESVKIAAEEVLAACWQMANLAAEIV